MQENGEAAYADAGVDLGEADAGLVALVNVLAEIDPGRESLVSVKSGHYATVLRLDSNLGIALGTDGVGTKIVVAQQMGRFDTIGIDCVAMNVNDVVCVGAKPLALVDYLAVEEADPQLLSAIARGLKEGAELAEIEIPGGELAQVRELIRGHPSPKGFDLVGTCIGRVELDAIVTGDRIEPGDAIIGLPSSGIHSNGLTLARTALLEQGGLALEDRPPGLDRSLGEELLQPTEIYVRAILDLLRSEVDTKGLAHITGGGLDNLLRLNNEVGYEIDRPLPAQPIFRLIQELGSISMEEMRKVFNMGTGFCCIVASEEVGKATELLRPHYESARQIGAVTGSAGLVTVHETG